MAYPSYGTLAQTNAAFRQQQQPLSSSFGQQTTGYGQQPFSSGYAPQPFSSSQATLRTPGLSTTTVPGQIFGGLHYKKKKGGRKSRRRSKKGRKTRRRY